MTLVELVVASALLLMALASVLMMLTVGFRTQTHGTARSNALDDAQVAMGRMSKEIRQALSVDPASTASSLSMLTLIEGVQHLVVYDVLTSTLRRTQDGGTPITLATGLTSASIFTYSPDPWISSTPTAITVSISLMPSNQSSTPVVLSTDVELRNAS